MITDPPARCKGEDRVVYSSRLPRIPLRLHSMLRALLLLSACLCISLPCLAEDWRTLREWKFRDGTTEELRLVNAYERKLFFENAKGKGFNADIRALMPEDVARVIAFARERDAAIMEGKPPPPSEFTRHVRQETQRMVDGELVQPSWDGVPEPEFYCIYYSASWCGPCRNFTPRLVTFYNSLRAAGDRSFEVILVPWDKTGKAMRNYIKKDAMPWLAVDWKHRNDRHWTRHEGDGIPCLVILDREGNLLAHTYDNSGEYLGASSALSELAGLVKLTRNRSEKEPTVTNPFAPKLKLRQSLSNIEISRPDGSPGPSRPKLILLTLDGAPRVQDASAEEREVSLDLMVNAAGLVTSLTVLDEDLKHLEPELRLASMLWQCIPAFENNVPTASHLVIKLPLRPRRKDAPAEAGTGVD